MLEYLRLAHGSITEALFIFDLFSLCASVGMISLLPLSSLVLPSVRFNLLLILFNGTFLSSSFFFFFFGPHLWNIEVPRLGVEWEL